MYTVIKPLFKSKVLMYLAGGHTFKNASFWLMLKFLLGNLELVILNIALPEFTFL